MNGSLFALIGRTFVLMRARAMYYWSIALTTIAAVTGVTLLLPNIRGVILIEGLFWAIAQAMVYARIAADDAMLRKEGGPAPFDANARIFERLWAVVVIDFALAMLDYGTGVFVGPRTDAVAVAAIVGSLLASALLLVADVSATVDDGGNVLTLLPRSLYRSIRFALSRNIARVIVIIALQYLVGSIGELVAVALFGDVPNAYADWLKLALGTITLLPIAALTTLMYLDATRAHE